MSARLETITVKETLITETCCECGVHFAFPEDLYQRRKDQGGSFYCPNGHCLHYRNTTIKRLEAAVRQERDRADQLEMQAKRLQDQLTAESKRLKREQTKLRRAEQRVHAGVCLHCNRHFVNLERHMSNKHGTPEEKAATIEEARRDKGHA